MWSGYSSSYIMEKIMVLQDTLVLHSEKKCRACAAVELIYYNKVNCI